MKGTDAPSRATLALKVCVAGDFKVGKSSLVRRFVSGTFSDDYIATLGAKVSSRRFSVPDPFRPGDVREVQATVWDLMGQRGFRDMIQDAFFLHAGGILYVADATRPETLYGLEDWHKAVAEVAGAIPGLVLVNKSDLADQIRIPAAEAQRYCADRGWAWVPTSAKTGAGVEEAFRHIGGEFLRRLAVSSPRA